MTDLILRLTLVASLYALSGSLGHWVDLPELDGCATDTECAELCPDNDQAFNCRAWILD